MHALAGEWRREDPAARSELTPPLQPRAAQARVGCEGQAIHAPCMAEHSASKCGQASQLLCF